MKGDFTRFTHDPKKHYIGVLKQQGRVDLDSDWNEQVEIGEHLQQTAQRDMIGRCGVPEEGGGFGIEMVPVDLFGVHFPDSLHGWAVGSQGTILATVRSPILPAYNEKDVKWSRQSPPPGVTVNLHAVFFLDKDRGWIVGDGGIILSTDDGGRHWTKSISGVSENLNAVYFIDSKNGWAVGEKGTIIYWDGNRWSPQESNTKVNLNAVHFIDSKNGWAVGAGGIILHWDGNRWSPQESNTKANLNAVHFIDGTGWSMGEGGTIIYWDGDNWSSKENNPNTNLKYTNANLKSVYFIDSSNGWAVGDGGTILYHKGNSWSPQESKTKASLNAVCFIDSKNGWAVGNAASILTPPDLSGKWENEKLNNYLDHSILISKGRIYVDGILAELEEDATYWNQPDYSSHRPLEEDNRLNTDLVYLDVWQRHITADDDPEIREVALGGPDTTTRTKTVAQVKILSVVFDKCRDLPSWNALVETTPSGGLLSTMKAEALSSKKPCEVSPSAGYQGLDNRLYRVEIHSGGNLGKATFKWSKDNGSIVYPVDAFVSDKMIRLERLGRDSTITLQTGDLVEVLDDARDLGLQPGTIAKVVDIDLSNKEMSLDTVVEGYDIKAHPKVRKWDGHDTVAKGPISLGEGIEIGFLGKNFRSGDYWNFSARTIGGGVEELENEPPKGIEHHYCALAIIDCSKNPCEVIDCRRLFPPLTGLINFFYVGGDGQEAMPGEKLKNPLQVGVSNWRWPVAGAQVRFEVEKSGGIVTPVDTCTDLYGIARCEWQLGLSGCQRVKATLLNEKDEQIGLPIYFNADLSIANEVYYDSANCNILGKTVQYAIDRLYRVISLHYVSGDNQEAVPDLTKIGSPIILSEPLMVSVVNECGPVSGAKVEFEAIDGGELNGTGSSKITVDTDPYGMARCRWSLIIDPNKPHQSVEARLIQHSNYPAHPMMSGVHFTAKLRIAEKVSYNPRICSKLGTNIQDALDRLCEMVGGKDSIHITGVFCNNGRSRLKNNETISVAALNRGIAIEFDTDANKESFKDQKPTCIITLDLPYPLNSADVQLWPDNFFLIGFQPLILSSEVTWREGGNSITLKPKEITQKWLEDRGLWEKVSKKELTRLLAHLTLKGDFIWSGPAESPEKYLDGEAFAVEDRESNLRFSGDGRQGGDFEMWFWLKNEIG